MRLPAWLAHHVAALRALLVLTVLVGLAYPLALTAIGRIPGLQHRADGSLITVAGRPVGSSLIGQVFTDVRYFHGRPSAAGKDGYDPTATAASNLGPEDVVDTPDRKSLLTQVCSRSLAIGKLEGVDGSRSYCTADGIGAVLEVFRRDGLTGPITKVLSVNGPPFLAEYQGVPVTAGHGAVPGGVIVPIRGNAPAHPAVPADAVTASGSGLDPDISVAYANLQAPRIARERGLTLDRVHELIGAHTDGRALGFMGEPGVNVLELNLALDGH